MHKIARSAYDGKQEEIIGFKIKVEKPGLDTDWTYTKKHQYSHYGKQWTYTHTGP